METAGTIRCTECGYKNSPLYHYCGECGAVLKRPEDETPPAPPPRRPASHDPAPITGMSFLGLDDTAPSSGSDYLLDEPPPERSWGRFVVLLLVLAVGSALGWQWWKGGFPFAHSAQTQPVVTPPLVSDQAAPEVQNPEPAPQPAPEQAAVPPVDSNPENSSNSTPMPAATAPPSETPPAPTASPAATAEPAPAEQTPEPVEKPKPVSMTRPKPTPAKPAEPEVSPGEALFVQGQRYLYGTGVEEDCDRALKSLLAAAGRAHTRAQSTLGAMYSTGHCVTRDLPAAYRWFARALRQDPSNVRLQQNLEVVWRQMTPGERQLATQNR